MLTAKLFPFYFQSKKFESPKKITTNNAYLPLDDVRFPIGKRTNFFGYFSPHVIRCNWRANPKKVQGLNFNELENIFQDS